MKTTLAFSAPILRFDAPVASAFASAATPAYRLLVAMAALTAILFAVHGLSLAGPEFALVALLAAGLVGSAWAMRARGWERVASPLEAWVLWIVTCLLSVLASYGVAADAAPLADGTLARIDGWLAPGFDWPAGMRALARHPWMMAGANRAYGGLHWQPPLLFVACALAGRPDQAWRFLTAWIATLFVVLAVLAFAPALGPYPHYALTAADVPAMRDPAPWTTPGVLTALRDGSLRRIGFMQLQGIVTAPSFHAGGAVLLAWGFWPLRGWRWPLLALAGAMFASAVPVGGHYLCDLPAGALAAVLGIAVATWTGRGSRTAPSRERAGLG